MSAAAKRLGKLQRTALWLLNRNGYVCPDDLVLWARYGDTATPYEDGRERPDPTFDWRRHAVTRSQLVSARRALNGLVRAGLMDKRYNHGLLETKRTVTFVPPGKGESDAPRFPVPVVEAAVLVALESTPVAAPMPVKQLSRAVAATLGEWRSSLSWQLNRALWRLERRGVLRLETRLRPEWDYGGPDHRRRYILTVTRQATECCLAITNSREATNAGAA